MQDSMRSATHCGHSSGTLSNTCPSQHKVYMQHEPIQAELTMIQAGPLDSAWFKHCRASPLFRIMHA